MTKGMGGGEGRASICGRMRRAPLPENPVKPVLALCCALLLVPSALAAETLKYVALVDGGKKAGEQTVTTGDDGVTRVDFIFKDNGRGPELKEEYQLAADGTFQRYQVKGVSTFGAPVDETFTRDGDTARAPRRETPRHRRVRAAPRHRHRTIGPTGSMPGDTPHGTAPS